MAAVKANPELAGENDKALMKKIMPFAKFMMDKALTAGPAVLDVKLAFGEREVLEDNLEYMMRSLNLDEVKVRSCDEAAGDDKPPECEGVYPGNPALVVRQEPAA
eukprot:scaffold56658_cov32-Prasinocladus_malaysianus.AAC.1